MFLRTDLLFDLSTQGGIFTTPGDAYTTPIEMWIKGLGKSTLLITIFFRVGDAFGNSVSEVAQASYLFILYSPT